jgi:hypothetical protein
VGIVVNVLISTCVLGSGLIIAIILRNFDWPFQDDYWAFYFVGAVVGELLICLTISDRFTELARKLRYKIFKMVLNVLLRRKLTSRFWTLTRVIADDFKQDYCCNRCKGRIPIGLYYYDTNEIPDIWSNSKVCRQVYKKHGRDGLEEYVTWVSTWPWVTIKFCIDCALAISLDYKRWPGNCNVHLRQDFLLNPRPEQKVPNSEDSLL